MRGCVSLCACFFFFSAAVVCASTVRAPRRACFCNRRGGDMSRCMRAPQVVRLCVPKMPCVAAVARRRCGRAACIASTSSARVQIHWIIFGCISRPSSCGDASHCIGLHIYAAPHSSAATRCFLAVILASLLYRLLRCWSADVGHSRLLVEATLEVSHRRIRSFAPTEAAAVRLSRFRFRKPARY